MCQYNVISVGFVMLHTIVATAAASLIKDKSVSVDTIFFTIHFSLPVQHIPM
jgi:hypothetical protein